MRLGDFEIRPIVDGTITVPTAMVYPNLTDADWAPHQDLLVDGQFQMSTGGFLLTRGETVALVDVGAGAVEAVPDFGGKFIDSLLECGYKPEDVTDVIFSHLHFDHIGWASANGQAMFANATYRCHSKDWDYFMTQATPQPESAALFGLPTDTAHWMEPVTDRMQMWDGDTTLLPGVDTRDAPGHTHGSSLIVISSGEERAVLLGDAAHCPAELLESEWEGLADVDPALAKRTREALAKEFEGTNVPLSAPHFPGLKFGRLLEGKGRTSWVFD